MAKFDDLLRTKLCFDNLILHAACNMVRFLSLTPSWLPSSTYLCVSLSQPNPFICTYYGTVGSESTGLFIDNAELYVSIHSMAAPALIWLVSSPT